VAAPSLRLGSSKGLTPDPCESTDTGDCGTVVSVACLPLNPAGESITGDFPSAFDALRELLFFVFGTSCSLKASPCPNVYDPVSRCCGFGRSILPSAAETTVGDAAADADAGVFGPDVSRFLVDLPFS